MNYRSIKYLILSFLLFSQLLGQDFPVGEFDRSDLRKSESRKSQTYLTKYRLSDTDANYDVMSYHLDLTIEPVNRMIKGWVKMTAKSQIEGLEQIFINLENNMQIDSILFQGNTIDFQHINNIIEIVLPVTFKKDEIFSITTYYNGNPENSPTRSFAWATHGIGQDPLIWTLSEPYGSPSWWPCHDNPEDKADSVRINVTVPSNLYVASNGLLENVTYPNNGQTKYHWHTRYPISTYLVSLAISDYARFSDWYIPENHDSMEIQYYVLPEHLEAAKRDLEITVDMMEFYGDIFGEYPFIDEKYGMAVFGWGGAMEHQTITSYGAGLIRGDNTFDYINAHELAHQWFGDLITMRFWSHIWLNEGFASYAEALWFEDLYGKAVYDQYMMTQWSDQFNGPLWIEDSLNTGALFSGTVYDKGSWTLHMLRGVLGDSLFFAAIKEYATNKNLVFSNATTENFRDICESVSGMKLDWFFDQWVYREGRPSYIVQWSIIGEDPYETRLAIVQKNLPAYKMPINIKLSTAEVIETFTIWDSLEFQQFTFNTPFKPSLIEFDPDNQILKTILDEAPSRFKVSANYPNPFNSGTNINVFLADDDVIKFEIYNVLGQRVYQTQESLISGYHQISWDGKNSHGNAMPSGMYFSRISGKTESISGKMILLR
jgi:aminopeptidase N